MNKLEITGGARVGMANATWPFAKLSVSRDRLDLNAFIIGNLAFLPKDIISIEPFKTIPLVRQGLKIIHRVQNYNSNVIFWTFTDPYDLLNEIALTGFLENTDPTISEVDELIIKQQKNDAIPVKIPVLIGAVVLWNLFFMFDIKRYSESDKKGFPLGIGAETALSMLILVSVLSLTTKSFSKLILKEGRSIEHINRFLYFLIFICSFLLLGLLSS